MNLVLIRGAECGRLLHFQSEIMQISLILPEELQQLKCPSTIESKCVVYNWNQGLTITSLMSTKGVNFNCNIEVKLNFRGVIPVLIAIHCISHHFQKFDWFYLLAIQIGDL